MKKTFLIAAAVIAMISCDNKAAQAGQMPGQTEATDMTAYENAVLELHNDSKYRPGMKPSKPTVIDFNATWCGPCKAFKPVFHAAAPKYPSVQFVSADVDRLPQTAQAFGVRGVPTVVFINTNGRMTTFVGTNELLPAYKFNNLVDSIFNR